MELKQIKEFFCVARFADVPVDLETDAGHSTSTIKGEVLLQGTNRNNSIKLRFRRFDAVAEPVQCKDGSSGLISLGFTRGSDRVTYGERGEIDATVRMNLHYPLITRVHGFRRMEQKEKDNYVPYVAAVQGRISGKFDKQVASVLRQFKSFDDQPSVEIALSVSLLAELYSVKKLDFKYKVKAFLPLAIMHSLNVQPVFIRSDPGDPSPTGWSCNTLMENARVMWRKCCIDLNVLPPIYIDDASFKSISTQQDAINLMGQISDDPDAIEVFFTESLGSLEAAWGGGATFSSGTASAKIVTCDKQLEVYQGTTSLGALNYNHLAHELGHVLSLDHPGAVSGPPMIAATANTVLEPSGFYADNPHPQSQFNCDNATNPVLKWKVVKWSRRCRQHPEL